MKKPTKQGIVNTLTILIGAGTTTLAIYTMTIVVRIVALGIWNGFMTGAPWIVGIPAALSTAIGTALTIATIVGAVAGITYGVQAGSKHLLGLTNNQNSTLPKGTNSAPAAHKPTVSSTPSSPRHSATASPAAVLSPRSASAPTVQIADEPSTFTDGPAKFFNTDSAQT